MKFKLPFSSTVISEARLYALESISHTLNYDGWGDAYDKMGRITRGKAAQLWLSEFCRINCIEHVKDTSSPFIPDKMDLSICGYPIDSKAGFPGYVGQISPNMKNQQKNILYFFFETDRTLSYLLPVGAQFKKACIDKAAYIEKGSLIPGTNNVQRFGEGSYFLPESAMRDFEYAIEWLLKHDRSNQTAEG